MPGEIKFRPAIRRFKVAYGFPFSKVFSLVLGRDRQVIRSDLFSEQLAIKDLQLVPADPSLGDNLEYYNQQAKEIFFR